VTTAYPQARLKDTTEDGARLRRVSGGSDVSGSPTRFYIAFNNWLRVRAILETIGDPINYSFSKCCGRTLISLTERSAPGSFASCVNKITASVVGRMPVNSGRRGYPTVNSSRNAASKRDDEIRGPFNGHKLRAKGGWKSVTFRSHLPTTLPRIGAGHQHRILLIPSSSNPPVRCLSSTCRSLEKYP
jgi:hypothetical protein